MEIIIDRFEGEYVIIELENNKVIQAPNELFPSAQAGDVFKISKNISKTNERHKLIRERFNKLKKK